MRLERSTKFLHTWAALKIKYVIVNCTCILLKVIYYHKILHMAKHMHMGTLPIRSSLIHFSCMRVAPPLLVTWPVEGKQSQCNHFFNLPRLNLIVMRWWHNKVSRSSSIALITNQVRKKCFTLVDNEQLAPICNYLEFNIRQVFRNYWNKNSSLI